MSKSRTMKIAVASGLVLSLAAFFALMADAKKEPPPTHPKVVLLIRHAEKPPENEASPHLSAAGLKRAAALGGLFEKTEKRPDPFPRPDVLVAAKPGGKSRRSFETLEPLAKATGAVVVADYEKEEFAKLAGSLFRDPKYAGKVVLVAWNHSMIPDLATALKAPNHPLGWKDDVFDQVWQFTYDDKGMATFKERPMLLLDGDKAAAEEKPAKKGK